MHCWICGLPSATGEHPDCVDEHRQGWKFYYCHPESECVWREFAPITEEGDGLWHEISAHEFYRLRQEGWSDGSLPF